MELTREMIEAVAPKFRSALNKALFACPAKSHSSRGVTLQSDINEKHSVKRRHWFLTGAQAEMIIIFNRVGRWTRIHTPAESSLLNVCTETVRPRLSFMASVAPRLVDAILAYAQTLGIDPMMGRALRILPDTRVLGPEARELAIRTAAEGLVVEAYGDEEKALRWAKQMNETSKGDPKFASDVTAMVEKMIAERRARDFAIIDSQGRKVFQSTDMEATRAELKRLFNPQVPYYVVHVDGSSLSTQERYALAGLDVPSHLA